MRHKGIGEKTLSLILAFCMMISLLPTMSLPAKAETTGNWIDSAASSYAGGTGAVDAPYQIASAEQLAYLAKQVNAGNDYSGIYFIQTAAIDLAGKAWTPIGYFPDSTSTTVNTFKGNYDGGNLTISNLCINNTTTRSVTNYTGLFGYIGFDKADKININCIKNVTLSSVTVSANNSDSNQIGALVGFGGVCEILNCSVSGGSVSCNGPASGCGGLIGAFSSIDRTYVANCWANVSVTNTGSTQYGSTGGFVGCFGDGAATIANCYARGDVSSSSGGGGFSGWSYGQLVNCYSTGKVNSSYTPCAHNTSNSSFKVLSLSTYYLSDTDDSAVSGWSGTGKTADTMKSQAFSQTLNINRSCASGLMPADITLYKWKIAAGENDGYPVFDTAAADASDGTISNSGATFSGGDGSQSTPYQISSKADMIQYEVNINSYTQIGTSGTYYSAAHYIVTKDIDMGGVTFTPIGLTDQTAFSGSMDFQNHVIVNYTPDTSTGVSTDYGGLLGVTNNPTISNYAAAIIGTADSGTTLSDVAQTVSVKTSGGTYDDSTGYSLIQSGEYLLRESYGWSGTVTPSKSGYIFTPASRTYSAVKSNQTGQNYTAAELKPTLTATADSANNCVNLNWTPVSTDDHYMVYQRDSGETIYQSIPVSTAIKVLNVYPDATGSDSLKTWMDTYGSPTVNGVKYTMAVTKETLSDFNTNYANYLKPNSDGSYNYDVIYFGACDANNNMDLSANALTAVKAFMDYGGGCLLGHDTESFNHANFIALAETYLNMDVNYVGEWTNGGKNSAYPTFGGEKVLVHKKGLLTNYPYSLGGVGTVLTTPLSHSYYEFAMGDVWFTYQPNTWSETKDLATAEKSVSIGGIAGTNNFYLTTWKNCAAIQTGHSNGEASVDEQKILTNTLYYLAQVTKGTSATDHMAQDLAAPDAVTSNTVAASTNGDTALSWTAPTDNGSTYDYYVREFTAADGSSHVDSDTANATVTTGVKGYYVLVDQNATATADAVKAANQFVTGPSYTSALTAGNYYAHILTLDNADNESGVTSAPFTLTNYTATVNININGSAAAAPGTVELKQNGTTKATLTGSSGVYTASVASGTYHVFVNSEDTGADITSASNIATVNYYTVSFSASDSGAASGSTVTATAGGPGISSGTTVLSGKKVELTATGAGIGTDATTPSYTYAWTGDGTSGETTAALTVTSLAGKIDATCTVTGSAAYAVTLSLDGGKVNSGDVTAYTYGTGATLPTDVTKTGNVFGGWYVSSDFAGSAVTAIGNTDKGTKTFYAKWVLKSPVAGSGDALSFDGTDDYVDVPSTSAYTTNEFTAEAWIQYDTNQDWTGVVDKGRNINKNWWILTSDGSNRGVTVGMQGAGELIYKWNDSDWHHVCITYDGTTFSLYVDGVLSESKAVSLSVYQANLADAAIDFGRRQSSDTGGFRYFNGKIDEVKVWNTGRTQAQIRSDMYNHPSSSESGLVGYWNFDEGSGSTASDSSATAAGSTLINMDTSSVWLSSTAWQNRATAQDTALVIDAGYSPGGGSVALAATTNPLNGTLSFSDTDKTVTYTPNSGYHGSDTFTYSVTNSVGTSSSYTVNMTVVQNPVMTGPTDLTAAAGASASFAVNVTAPSSGLSYQWQKSTDGGSNWSNITAATGATYTIDSVAAGDAGKYRCVVTATDETTTAVTTSGEATLTVTFTATVNIKLDDVLSATPVGTGVVLKKSGSSDVALAKSTDGTYTANVVNGDYYIYLNDENVGQININSNANSATLNYYTVSFSVSNAGVASGSTVTATAGGTEISSGAVVLSGKKVVLTATGAGLGNDAANPSYTYAWTGDGTNSATTSVLTIGALSSAVNAKCAVTGSATYPVTLNENGGTVNSGNVTSYDYGTGATLPTDITKAGSVFGGWYAASDFSGSAATAIGTADKGAKTFYAKWVQNPVMTGPENKTAAKGASASFTITVSAPSTGLSYQWQKLDGSDWKDISGATGATYTIGSVTAGDAGQYRCVVTATDGVAAVTTSGEATLTVTFIATVNVNINDSAATAPGAVELKQNGDTKATLSGSDGIYTASVVNGIYIVYVNSEDTGKTLTIDNDAANVTANYYTVSFSASDSGAASGSTVTATAGGTGISSGATVLSGKKIVLTATGAGASYYEYFWSGSGANGQTSDSVTISSLSFKVNALCTVTGRTTPTTYSISLNTNGGSISSGSIVSYTYGTGAKLPSNVTREGFVFAGWYADSDFSGSTVTEISSTDTGDKTFYAKWRYYTVDGTVVDDKNNPLDKASVTIRGNNITKQTATTDVYGEYSFNNIPKGEYNIIATYKGVTTTIIISVVDKDISDAKIVMPTAGAENSIVTVKDATPDIVVGNLDKQFSGTDDTYVSTAGNTVKLELAVEEKSKEEESDATSIQAQAGSRTIDMYLDMKLTKTQTGTVKTNEQLSYVDGLLKIIIPYDLSGKTNVVVYRVHEGVTAALTEQTYSESTPSDECYMVNTAENQVVVWAKKFSTYAIAYSNVIYDSGSKYTVTASAGTGGSISPSGISNVTSGKSQTYAIAADKGYYISDVLVDGKSVGAVGSYTFTNVTAAHTISAVFIKAEGLPYYLDGSGGKVFIGFAEDTSGEMKYIAPEGKTVLFTPNPKSFTDISGHWAKSYIDFVTQREIFIGTGNNIFSPDTGMTRAMFATVIGRLYERSYGTLVNTGTHAFTDCDYALWYGSYIDWCSENGIIKGVGGGLFEPNREITREEMAAILYRFAEFMKVSTIPADAALSYPDSAKIASWAEQAALYCQETGIIEGRDGGNFVPQGTATRAEVAAILERFIKKVV